MTYSLMIELSRDHLFSLYHRLYSSYGPQHWWPANSRFEIMLGAILTQNTAWTNVEKAIANLKQARCLTAVTIDKLSEGELASLIRPSGYFNIKAKRIQNFTRWYLKAGEYRRLKASQTTELRQQLLSVNGIGPETADDILLYAFERPVFVIDAYTRRLLVEIGWISGNESYEALRSGFEMHLDSDVPLYNEFHALIVRHAKEKCSETGGCRHCFVVNG